MSELYKIGDVAQMFHLSVGTLRHYEKLGLVEPEYVDNETGYRYYSIRQFEPLNTICYLRALDLPLSEIQEFLKNRNLDKVDEILVRQRVLVEKKELELKRIEKKIEHRLFQLREARNASLERIEVSELKKSRIAWFSDSVKPQSFLDLEHQIRRLEAGQSKSNVFLGKVGVGISQDSLLRGHYDSYDLVFLILDEEDDYSAHYDVFEATKCVSVRFCGSHQDAKSYYKLLIEYINNNHYKITGFSREITLIDYGLTDDTSQFVTQIQIPIE